MNILLKYSMKYLLSILIFTTLSFAHPHTFIEVYPTVYSKNKNIDKINIKWVIDEITSMMLIMEFDVNGNGKIDKDENQFIHDNYFASLEQYNFYMDIQSKKSTSLPVIPENFKATIKDNKIVYNFDIQEVVKIPNIKINFKDETLFVGMILKEEYINIASNDKKLTNIFGIN